MKIVKKSILVVGVAALMFTSCNKDDDNTPQAAGDKDGILLVTFGSTFAEPQSTFKTIDVAAKAEFPGEDIRWGYTSDDILNKLRNGTGDAGLVIDNDSPEEAMEVMYKDGISKFAIQSLHVIPGEEYDEMVEAAEKFKHNHTGVEISIGKPLLTSDADIKAVAAVLAEKFKTEVAAGPVLFMGHGTPHAADAQYDKLDAELKKLNPNFFVGTVEGIGFDAGRLSIGGLVTEVNKISPKPTTVTVTPFMSVAGDHANNDMVGVTGETDPAEQSWKERLEGEGYTVNVVMKGLGDYDEINAIWMSHLEAIK